MSLRRTACTHNAQYVVLCVYTDRKAAQQICSLKTHFYHLQLRYEIFCCWYYVVVMYPTLRQHCTDILLRMVFQIALRSGGGGTQRMLDILLYVCVHTVHRGVYITYISLSLVVI